MLFGLFANACGAQAPAGQLTYCSYSNAGAAGLGKDYCELIADIGQTPKVVVALNLDNRFGTPEIHAEYPVEQAVVDSLQAKLAEAKVYELNGYNVDEAMTGGHTYRIYQEYSSGEKVNAHWYGHHIKEEAVSSYYMIEAFFRPWRERAVKENDPVVSFEIIAKKVAGLGADRFILQARQGFSHVIFDVNVGSRTEKEIHDQFNLDSADDLERVRQLQQDLIALKTSSLGDYKKDDVIEGGTKYTVELKYASGAEQTLYWHSNSDDVNPTAQAVYSRIRAFFNPWVK